MSYGIIPYSINLERLNSRFGIVDEAKRNKIREKCNPYAKNFDSRTKGNESPKFSDIVEELLDGKATYSECGYLYWHAINVFIEELGQSLPNQNWYPSSADIFFEHPSFKLFAIKSSFKIPTPDDFPTVFVLHKEKMDENLLISLKEKITDQKQFSELSDWIGKAKKYNEDLVLYYH